MSSITTDRHVGEHKSAAPANRVSTPMEWLDTPIILMKLDENLTLHAAQS